MTIDVSHSLRNHQARIVAINKDCTRLYSVLCCGARMGYSGTTGVGIPDKPYSILGPPD